MSMRRSVLTKSLTNLHRLKMTLSYREKMLKISLPQQSNAGFDPKVKGVYFQGSPVKFFSQVSRVPASGPSLFSSHSSLLSSSSQPHPALKYYFNMMNLLRVGESEVNSSERVEKETN